MWLLSVFKSIHLRGVASVYTPSLRFSGTRSWDKTYCKRRKGCPQLLLKYLPTPRKQNMIIELLPLSNSGSHINSNQIFSFYSCSVLTRPKIEWVFQPSPFHNGCYNPTDW